MAHNVPESHEYGLGGILTTNNPDITQATVAAGAGFEYKWNKSQSKVWVQEYLHGVADDFIKVKVNGPATATDWDAVLDSGDMFSPPEGMGKITSIGIWALGSTHTYQTTFTIKGVR